MAGVVGLAGLEAGEEVAEGGEVGGVNSLVRASAPPLLGESTWYVTVEMVCVLALCMFPLTRMGGSGAGAPFSFTASLFSVGLSLFSVLSLFSESLALAWEGEPLATLSILRAMAKTLLLVFLLPNVPAVDCVVGNDAERM